MKIVTRYIFLAFPNLAAHILSIRFYDVAVGCAIALAGTLAVRALTRPVTAS